MTWELRKIGSSGRLCLLLVLAVLCNGVLFALHAAGDADGYTVSALRQAMAQEDLNGYEERLWQELEQVAYTARAVNTTPAPRAVRRGRGPGAGAAGGGISLLPGGLGGGIPPEAADGTV